MSPFDEQALQLSRQLMQEREIAVKRLLMRYLKDEFSNDPFEVLETLKAKGIEAIRERSPMDDQERCYLRRGEEVVDSEILPSVPFRLRPEALAFRAIAAALQPSTRPRDMSMASAG